MINNQRVVDKAVDVLTGPFAAMCQTADETLYRASTICCDTLLEKFATNPKYTEKYPSIVDIAHAWGEATPQNEDIVLPPLYNEFFDIYLTDIRGIGPMLKDVEIPVFLLRMGITNSIQLNVDIARPLLQRIASDATEDVTTDEGLTAMAGVFWQLNIDSDNAGTFCSTVQNIAMAKST